MIDQHTNLQDGDRVRLKRTCSMGSAGQLGKVVVGFAGLLSVAFDRDNGEEAWIEIVENGRTYWAVDLVEKVYEPPISQVVDLLIDGMMNDGSHHKQWYLDQALRLLVGPSGYDNLVTNMKDEYGWDEGIAP